MEKCLFNNLFAAYLSTEAPILKLDPRLDYSIAPSKMLMKIPAMKSCTYI
jgi:hypothetical protein